MTIHDQIKARRLALGWSMETLAAEVSKLEGLGKPLSWQTVQQWEAGKSAPKRSRLEIVASLLGSTVAELMDEPGRGSAVSEVNYLPGFQNLSIPVLANSGSMGDGADQLHDEVVVGRLTVSPDWALRTLKPTSLPALRFIHGYGDSMAPTFSDGDVLLVDTGVQECKVDGVYVLEANDRIYIKRVRQRMNGDYEISSDNPNVKTVDVLDGNSQVTIRGRVLWGWKGERF